jgi:hypothetical protein
MSKAALVAVKEDPLDPAIGHREKDRGEESPVLLKDARRPRVALATLSARSRNDDVTEHRDL